MVRGSEVTGRAAAVPAGGTAGLKPTKSPSCAPETGDALVSAILRNYPVFFGNVFTI